MTRLTPLSAINIVSEEARIWLCQSERTQRTIKQRRSDEGFRERAVSLPECKGGEMASTGHRRSFIAGRGRKIRVINLANKLNGNSYELPLAA